LRFFIDRRRRFMTSASVARSPAADPTVGKISLARSLRLPNTSPAESSFG
jgi:hypothetical protein